MRSPRGGGGLHYKKWDMQMRWGVTFSSYRHVILLLALRLIVGLITPKRSYIAISPHLVLGAKFQTGTVSDVLEETETIVIGSGLAGLSCAALLTHSGYNVTVLESHDTLGGCAHGWKRNGYHFESGPSLYSGFTINPSPNPLQNIFKIIGEQPEWITYDRWGTSLPEGQFAAKIGPEEWEDVLAKYGGPGAIEDWRKVATYMTAPGGLSEAAQAIPSLALREDWGAVFTLGKFWKNVFKTLNNGAVLNSSFATIRDQLGITNRFVLNWLDMLCFLLQGLPADGTLNAVIAYMLADWYRPGVTLDFPRGGSQAIVDALVRGILKNGGKVLTRQHVEEVEVENGVAVGVKFRDQRTKELFSMRATKAVVSNIDTWNTRKLVRRGQCAPFDQAIDHMLSSTPRLASFIHLHAGIDAAGLPAKASKDFPTQWAVVQDWDREGIVCVTLVVDLNRTIIVLSTSYTMSTCTALY